jgi:hypothetical protein
LPDTQHDKIVNPTAPATIQGAQPELEQAMPSNTAVSEARRKRNHIKMGQRRKKRESKRSTQSSTELFAGFGEPGQPAPKAK